MTLLTVQVSGQWAESRLMTLPVDVYAPDGTMLAQGTASPVRPATFDLPGLEAKGLDRVHVLATLPNGASLQETIALGDGQCEVTFRQGEQSPHEWLQWVTPFRSLSHLRGDRVVSPVVPRRIGQVWITVWTLADGRWKAQEAQALDRQRDAGMQQWVIDVPLSPTLLQIGGEEVAWRLVSLPPGGPVRVALTRSAEEEGDSLKITIGRSQPDDELIMSYLARGAVAHADRLAQTWNVAGLMHQDTISDPVSAAAGAYLLLRGGRLQDHREWIAKLVEQFPSMADGAIVSAALALQREDATESEIRAALALALDRGLPVFAMGASILVETMAAVHRGKRETTRFHAAYLAAQAYARAQCSKGPYFAFYGKSPAEPSWTPIYGLEGQAAANPASALPIEAVVYVRAVGSIHTGKFGATQVALPRAPVRGQRLDELRLDAAPLDEERVAASGPVSQRAGTTQRLVRGTIDVGVGAVETILMQDLSMGSERGVSLAAAQAGVLPRPKRKSEPVRGAAAQRARAQTQTYWQDERVKHAVTIFNGDE